MDMNYLNNSLFDFFDKLKKINSTNEKIKFLEKGANEEIRGPLLIILRFAYDPEFVWYIKTIPEYTQNMEVEENAQKVAHRLTNLYFDEIIENKTKGNLLREKLKEILEEVSFKDASVIERVIKKDLKCGINSKLINKAIPDLIHKRGYMGAVPYDPKKVDKIIMNNEGVIVVQEKMDGEYSNLVLEKVGNRIYPQFFSRNEKTQTFPEEIYSKLEDQFKNIPESIILNGELVIEGMDRYKSNGIFTQIFTYERKKREGESEKVLAKKLKEIEETSGMDYPDIIKNIRYIIWDAKFSTNDKYHIRLLKLKEYLNDFVLFCDTKIIYDEKSTSKNKITIIENIEREMDVELINVSIMHAHKTALKYFQYIVSIGGEGVIVKDLFGLWKDGKPTYQIKIKFEFECEMKITGFKQGTENTKYQDSLGAFITESKDSIVKADPSGISEDLRQEIWDNREKYIGKIITVKCNGLSQDKEGNYSLLHPRFIKFREDKNEADDFETIQKIEKALQAVS